MEFSKLTCAIFVKNLQALTFIVKFPSKYQHFCRWVGF